MANSAISRCSAGNDPEDAHEQTVYRMLYDDLRGWADRLRHDGEAAGRGGIVSFAGGAGAAVLRQRKDHRPAGAGGAGRISKPLCYADRERYPIQKGG